MIRGVLTSVVLLLSACSFYESSLLASRRGAQSGGSTSAAGVVDEGGEAGEGVSRGGTTSSGGVSTAGTGGDAGSDDGGAPVDTGGTGPASGGGSSGGASNGGTSSGGSSTGGTASGGVSAGGALTGGSAGAGTGGAKGGAGGSGGSGGAGGSTGGKNSGGASGTGGSTSGVLFSDNFEAGTASAWTPNTSGDWSVASDGSFVYRQGTVVNALRVASAGSAAWQNQSVQARMKVLAFGGTSVSSSYFAAIYARYTDDDNHYYLALRSDGKISIRRKIAGSNASIGPSTTPGQLISTGTWYTVKLEVIGTTLNAYVDGVLYDTVTDSSFASGKAGLGSSNASVVFDDVVVSLP